MDHSKLRQAIRRQRRALSPERQQQAARRLFAELIQLPVIQNAQHLALYLASDGEIDPAMYAQWAWQRGVKLYLPVIERAGSALRFAQYHEHCVLKANRFGIPEPDSKPGQWQEAEAMDVILMPLVAYDGQGNRIGMGGGFYDRTLAFKSRQPYHRAPELIGLAHSLQCVDKIIPASWDIPLDGIATEQRAGLFREDTE